MSRRRWLLFAYEYPPLGGGVATSLAALLERYQYVDDLSFEVITSSISGREYQTQLADNITMWYLPTRNEDQSLHRQTPLNMARYAIRSSLKAWQLQQLGRVDGVHVMGYPGVGNLTMVGIPSVVSLWGIEVPGYNPQYAVYYPLYKPLAQLAWKKATKVVAISDDIGRLAQASWGDLEYQVIPNGVDTSMFRPSTQKFESFTVTAGGTILGSIKGLEYLVRGFAILHQKVPHSKLLLIGDGPARESLLELTSELRITKAVECVGRQSRDWIATTLPRCHVLCLPSLNEGMSNAVLEGMASGLAIITTDTGGSKTLLKGAADIVDKKNHTQIASSLIALASSTSLLKTRSRQARNIACTLSWDRVATQYLDLYRQLQKPL